MLWGALAVIVGALIPVQAATNAAMSRAIGSVAITSLALFAIAFVVVAAWAIIWLFGIKDSRSARLYVASQRPRHKCCLYFPEFVFQTGFRCQGNLAS